MNCLIILSIMLQILQIGKCMVEQTNHNKRTLTLNKK